MGQECSISRQKARLHSGGICVREVRGENHSAMSGDTAGGAAPRVRAVKSSEFQGESCEHLRCTHLEQVQHCTDLPHQVTFPGTQSREDGARVGMNVTVHQEKKGKRRGEKKKRKQVTNFKEAVCCPSAVVQGAA